MTTMTKDVTRCRRCSVGRAKVSGLCTACWSHDVRVGREVHTLIVGLVPGTGTASSGPAFVGSKSGRFLAELCGLERDRSPDLLRGFDMVNLYADEDARRGEDGHELALQMVRERIFGTYSRVVLCGREVAAAFRHGEDWFTVVDRTIVFGKRWDYQRVAIPHPSGLCRTWNDQAVRDQGRELMTKWWKEST